MTSQPTCPSQPDTVVIADPGMRMMFGHHFNYNTLFWTGFLAHGVPTDFLLNKEMPQELRHFFPKAAYILEGNFYAFAHLNQGPFSEMMQHAALFAAELESGFNTKPNQLLFAHTLDPIRLTGLGLWYSRLPGHRKIRLALNVMLGVNDAKSGRTALKPAVRLFAGEEKVRLFGASKSIAALLAELSGRPCAMLPTPLPTALEEAASSAKNAAQGQARLLFGVTGDARRGKNLHLLPAAIIRYLREGGKGNFRLQMTPLEVEAHPEVLALAEVATLFPQRVQIILDRLKEPEYYSGISSLSAMILPYSPQAYNLFRPSGPAIEAAALGVPLISCAGGFIEDEVGPLENGSIFIKNQTPEELAAALFTFEREAEERQRRAREAAVGYRAFHNMENILQLIGIGEGNQAASENATS